VSKTTVGAKDPKKSNIQTIMKKPFKPKQESKIAPATAATKN